MSPAPPGSNVATHRISAGRLVAPVDVPWYVRYNEKPGRTDSRGRRERSC